MKKKSTSATKRFINLSVSAQALFSEGQARASMTAPRHVSPVLRSAWWGCCLCFLVIAAKCSLCAVNGLAPAERPLCYKRWAYIFPLKLVVLSNGLNCSAVGGQVITLGTSRVSMTVSCFQASITHIIILILLIRTKVIIIIPAALIIILGLFTHNFYPFTFRISAVFLYRASQSSISLSVCLSVGLSIRLSVSVNPDPVFKNKKNKKKQYQIHDVKLTMPKCR